MCLLYDHAQSTIKLMLSFENFQRYPRKMKIKLWYILAIVFLIILIIWKLTAEKRVEKTHFDRGIEQTIKALQKEQKSSVEFGKVFSDSKPQIKQVLLSTTWRSGSTFLADLLNQYPGKRWKWDFWNLKSYPKIKPGLEYSFNQFTILSP